MPPAYVTQTSRGLVVGSQDDLVEVFWRGEGVSAKLFGKILDGGCLPRLRESRCAARHRGSWGSKTGHVEICRRFRKVVANREVLDVLLGGPVTFGRANVLSSGRGSNGRAKIWRIIAMEVFRLVS